LWSDSCPDQLCKFCFCRQCGTDAEDGDDKRKRCSTASRRENEFSLSRIENCIVPIHLELRKYNNQDAV